jgi:hypothetical protein
MLDEELWIYMDLNIKTHDPYSLISPLNYVQPRTLRFPKTKILYSTTANGQWPPKRLYGSIVWEYWRQVFIQ